MEPGPGDERIVECWCGVQCKTASLAHLANARPVDREAPKCRKAGARHSAPKSSHRARSLRHGSRPCESNRTPTRPGARRFRLSAGFFFAPNQVSVRQRGRPLSRARRVAHEVGRSNDWVARAALKLPTQRTFSRRHPDPTRTGRMSFFVWSCDAQRGGSHQGGAASGRARHAGDMPA